MKILLTIIFVSGHLCSLGQERIQYEQIDVNHKEHNHEIIDSLILF